MTKSELEVAYEEWAENFEDPGEFSENAFTEGYRLGLSVAKEECVRVCAEFNSSYAKKGAFTCFSRIMDKLNDTLKKY